MSKHSDPCKIPEIRAMPRTIRSSNAMVYSLKWDRTFKGFIFRCVSGQVFKTSGLATR